MKELNEEQVLELSRYYLDLNDPNPDKVHDIALKMDLVYDELNDCYLDEEGLYDRVMKKINERH